jgi:transposase-like protein
MGQMKRRKNIREKAIAEYLGGDISYRELEERYGVSSSTLNRWVKEHKEGRGAEKEAIERVGAELAAGREELPREVKELQRELEEARLYNKLLNTMIDIAEERMGIPIRKKRGAKQ